MAGLDRRQVLKLSGGLGAAGLTAACGIADESQPAEPIYDTHARIGLLVPGTGGNKPIGDEILNGFRHFVHANGNRLGGHPVIEEEQDEGDSPASAEASLQRLLDRGVHAVVGVASSPALVAIRSMVEEAHVPLLGTSASPRDLQGVTYIWRTSYVNQEPGLALGTYLAPSVDGLVAIIAQDDATGTDAIAGLQEAFAAEQASDQLAEPILTPTESEPGPDFFASSLAQVQALGPEAVFCCYAGLAAVEFVRQYVEAGLDPVRLHAPAYLTEGAALEALGSDALGIKTSANYAAELSSSTNRAFTVDYQAEFSSAPTIYAVAAYDAAAALDKAIRLTEGNPTPRQVNLMLSRIGLIDSPRGRWQFNQSRTPIQKWYLREVATNGPVLANTVLRELGTLG